MQLPLLIKPNVNTQAAQDQTNGTNIIVFRYIVKHTFSFNCQCCPHNYWQGAVLGPADSYFPVQSISALNYELCHYFPLTLISDFSSMNLQSLPTNHCALFAGSSPVHCYER